MRKSNVFLLKEINVIAKKFLGNCVRMVQKFREMFFMDDTEKPMSFYVKKKLILQQHTHSVAKYPKNVWSHKCNYFLYWNCNQSSVRYIFFVIATATASFPKNVIATVIATFLKKVIATLLANFSLNHRYIFATFSLLLLFKIEKKFNI